MSDRGLTTLHLGPSDEPRTLSGVKRADLVRFARKLRSAAYKVDREGDSRAAWMRVAEVAVALDEMAVNE